MNNYIVESPARWFVVTTKNIKAAQSVGCKELGRGNYTVRKATNKEIDYYVSLKGEKALQQ